MTESSTTAGFVHLHVHTEFSPLDGMTKIGEAAAKVAADGQIALAATDHGDVGSAWQLNREANKHGIKPLVGAELYVAVMADWRAVPDRTLKESVEVDRDDDSAVDEDEDERGSAQVSAKKNKKYEHLTVFATTPTGWKNLSAMMDKAEETGFYAKPRIDYKLLKEHAEGLIVLTGCLGGPVLGPVSRGNMDQARLNLDRIIDAVGHENVFVEIMEHGIPAETNAVPALVRLASEYKLPIVATNDSHYTNEEDAPTHEAWLAVASGKSLTDPKRFHFHGTGYHIRTEAEMRALRPEKWWQIACDNTVAVAGRFDDNVLPEAKLRLPQYPIPAGFSGELAYIRSLIRAGSEKRHGPVMPQAVKDRVNLELEIINNQGFVSYFLIVWDLIKWAREDGNLPGWPHIEGGIGVGPGRGSAAGSEVSYDLEIVDIDPLENHLLFERFMEPGRTDMPDIDVDFELRYVERVRAYLAYKWGLDKVARIGTHNVAQTKAAIKDAARVLELPAIGAKLTKVVPKGAAGGVFSFADLDDVNNGASEKYRNELEAAGPDGARVVELAKRMFGTLKGQGIHACGILISTEPLRGLIPLRRDRSKAASGGLNVITAWDAGDVGDIDHYDPLQGGVGLLKLDVLSIRNLDIVSQACAFILETTGEVIDPRRLPHPNTLGDPRVQKTYALLKAGRTAGVFQMDGTGMQNMSRAIGPETLTDISAIVALFRPGPLAAQMDQLYAQRKAGLLPVTYDQFTSDPAEQEAIASVLGETYGVWVFQEQLMRLGGVIAGFDAGQRSKLRKAVSKKKKKDMEIVSALFLEGAVKEFRDEAGNITSMKFAKETAVRIIDAMQGSAEYLFNASHSAAYAQLAYTTAFLKANWPAEYGAAILAVTDDKEKRLSAIDALTGEGITILPPDINLSRGITAPAGDLTVRIGLSEINGVGELGNMVVAAREISEIRFSSLAELVRRLTEGSMGKVASIAGIEGLIEAGACDEFGPRLGQMMIVRAVKSQKSLKVPDAEWSVLERAMRQRAKLGVSLGEHPVTHYRQNMKDYRFHSEGMSISDGDTGTKLTTIKQIPDKDGAQVIIGGLLGQWSEDSYSKGRRANLTLEGSSLRISGVMWDGDLKALPTVPPIGSLVALQGRVNMRERDIEDEEGNVVETLITKELTVRRVEIIPVENAAVGAYIDARVFTPGVILPEIPVLELLKLPPKSKAKGTAKVPDFEPGGVVVNASRTPKPSAEPVPEPEPAPAVYDPASGTPEFIPFSDQPPEDTTGWGNIDDPLYDFEAEFTEIVESIDDEIAVATAPAAVLDTPEDDAEADNLTLLALMGVHSAPARPAAEPAKELRQATATPDWDSLMKRTV